MSSEQIILVNKDRLSHVLGTLERAKAYHLHQKSLREIEGVVSQFGGSRLIRDLELAIEVMHTTLNPAPIEPEVLEG